MTLFLLSELCYNEMVKKGDKMVNCKGKLIIISGPGGVGKNTIVDAYIDSHSNCCFSISFTSRERRSTEQEGKEYHFVTKEEFEKKIKDGEFLEYTIFMNNYYGTPKTNIMEKLDDETDVFLILDIKGAMNVKKMYPDAILIFILPPNLDILKMRLQRREKDLNTQIVNRLKRTANELKEVAKYNYTVVNDELEKTIAEIEKIMIANDCLCAKNK